MLPALSQAISIKDTSALKCQKTDRLLTTAHSVNCSKKHTFNLDVINIIFKSDGDASCPICKERVTEYSALDDLQLLCRLVAGLNAIKLNKYLVTILHDFMEVDYLFPFLQARFILETGCYKHNLNESSVILINEEVSNDPEALEIQELRLQEDVLNKIFHLELSFRGISVIQMAKYLASYSVFEEDGFLKINEGSLKIDSPIEGKKLNQLTKILALILTNSQLDRKTQPYVALFCGSLREKLSQAEVEESKAALEIATALAAARL